MSRVKLPSKIIETDKLEIQMTKRYLHKTLLKPEFVIVLFCILIQNCKLLVLADLV